MVVAFKVCGMRVIVISPVPHDAMVRLMPSIATEPFSAMNRQNSDGTAMVRSVLPFTSRS